MIERQTVDQTPQFLDVWRFFRAIHRSPQAILSLTERMMAAPSEAPVFAFDVPAHRTSAHQAVEDPSSQNSQDHVGNRYQAKEFVNSNSVSTQDLEKVCLDADAPSNNTES